MAEDAVFRVARDPVRRPEESPALRSTPGDASELEGTHVDDVHQRPLSRYHSGLPDDQL